MISLYHKKHFYTEFSARLELAHESAKCHCGKMVVAIDLSANLRFFQIAYWSVVLHVTWFKQNAEFNTLATP